MKKKTLIIICSAVLVVGIIIAAVIIFNREKPATPQPVPPGQQTEPDRDEPGTKVTPPVDYGDEEDKFTFTDEMGDLMFSHNQYFDNLTFNPSSSSLSGISPPPFYILP